MKVSTKAFPKVTIGNGTRGESGFAFVNRPSMEYRKASPSAGRWGKDACSKVGVVIGSDYSTREDQTIHVRS